MDSLKWEQNNAGLHIFVPAPDGTVAKFTISTSQINQLQAGTPPVYNVFVRFNSANDEQTYILDLLQLRPVIQKSSGLTLSLGKSKQKSTSYEGQDVGNAGNVVFNSLVPNGFRLRFNTAYCTENRN